MEIDSAFLPSPTSPNYCVYVCTLITNIHNSRNPRPHPSQWAGRHARLDMFNPSGEPERVLAWWIFRRNRAILDDDNDLIADQAFVPHPSARLGL